MNFDLQQLSYMIMQYVPQVVGAILTLIIGFGSSAGLPTFSSAPWRSATSTPPSGPSWAPW